MVRAVSQHSSCKTCLYLLRSHTRGPDHPFSGYAWRERRSSRIYHEMTDSESEAYSTSEEGSHPAVGEALKRGCDWSLKLIKLVRAELCKCKSSLSRERISSRIYDRKRHEDHFLEIAVDMASINKKFDTTVDSSVAILDMLDDMVSSLRALSKQFYSVRFQINPRMQLPLKNSATMNALRNYSWRQMKKRLRAKQLELSLR